MKKNRIRLSESQLHRVIKESVNKILKENEYDDFDDDAYMESYDYIIDSVINGQFQQARKLYKQNVRDPFDFIEYLDMVAPDYKQQIINIVRR